VLYEDNGETTVADVKEK